jgi:hypothetical protein
MLRPWVIWSCVFSLLGCTSNATLSGPQSGGLAGAREGSNETIRLVDQRGEIVYLHPDATLTISTSDGDTTEVRGKELCRSIQGISLRNGDSCARSAWIASWEEISSIEVEQFNGAATVAISTVAAVLVVGALIVLASDSKAKKSEPAGPKKTERTLASPSSGGAARPANHPGSAPARQRPPRRTSRGSTSVNVLVITSGSSPSSGGSPGEGEPSALVPLTDDEEPLFSERVRRRSVVSPFLRGDIGGCLGSASCVAGSLRAGVLLKDLVELSGGMRWDRLEEDPSRQFVLGAGLQGKFPSAPSLALALGSLVALGDKVRVAPYAGLRGHLGAGVWMGFQPLGVTFFLAKKRIAYTPSLDLAFTF